MYLFTQNVPCENRHGCGCCGQIDHHQIFQHFSAFAFCNIPQRAACNQTLRFQSQLFNNKRKTRKRLIACGSLFNVDFWRDLAGVLNTVLGVQELIDCALPPFSETPLRIFHRVALAPLINVISSFELHFVPIRVLRPYEPLLAPQTKSASVTSSARHSRMSKNSDN